MVLSSLAVICLIIVAMGAIWLIANVLAWLIDVIETHTRLDPRFCFVVTTAIVVFLIGVISGAWRPNDILATLHLI